ncbi:MAG TPA: orotate phosphoribosyltransferase [Bacteroidales bacterium]|nr:orotate phosphoribosyltransferase [Bacteroidales bacterium]
MEYSKKIAQFLIESQSVKLRPEEPFTWASGWKSPIYCDNRKTLAFPAIREYIKNAFVDMINKKFPEPDVIAGVATGAIAQGALVADLLKKPFCYVRSAPKDHGMANLIEGNLEPGQKVVVIEDLISTGGSSIKAVEALRNAKADVLGMVAIFTYGFESASQNFKKAGINVYTLSDYDTLLEQAISWGYINPSHLNLLKEWRVAPDKWGNA